MRNFAGSPPAGKRYFDGACEAMADVGAGDLLLSPGDVDPPGPVRATIDRFLGTNFLWVPLTGNHETEKRATMEWLYQWAKSSMPKPARLGPLGAEDTMFSFDIGNSHFVILNQYYDGVRPIGGKDVLPRATLDWLKADLAATRLPFIWVAGHKPMLSLPDMDSGRLRHAGESVSTNAQELAEFTRLLKRYRVTAYLCGHTHNASIAKVQGVWQIDSGHARGGGDTGAPSTFVRIRTEGRQALAELFRADPAGQNYRTRMTVELTGRK